MWYYPAMIAGSITNHLEQLGYQIIGRAQLPKREPRYLPIPSRLDRSIKNYLTSAYPDGLYAHQALAIDEALNGNDITLSTSTASGKSLVFITVAADLILRDPSARILALYPARALIQDQIEKWQSMLKQFGFRAGYIDGGVPTKDRPQILNNSRVLLMTPDVTHAWLMSHLQEQAVSKFMASIRLLILDEAHVYEGVFGTNMSYLLRRFRVAAAPHRLICSTATLGGPAEFVQKLTGRQTISLGPELDGSVSPEKTVLVTTGAAKDSFESKVNLLRTLARVGTGRFLAFADSRKTVELLVAATTREHGDDLIDDHPADLTVAGTEDSESLFTATSHILPYRAGYETEDRNEIQKALGSGRLAGVVSTSALELGLDIGEIDVVVLLSLPPTMKAFWQRLGRGSRKNPGACILVDDEGKVKDDFGGLESYMGRPLEQNWTYLENRYIQYANALCAAQELSELGVSQRDTTPFDDLPPSFRQYLDNELDPKDSVAADLYPLKQRAQSGPHWEFPLRNATERNFELKGPFDKRLGTLSFSQALREAYPGAVYYYMARPYRVAHFNYRDGELQCKNEAYYTTRPVAQVMVFPNFDAGILNLFRSDSGFVAECEMQVSERVLGFTQHRGSVSEKHLYGPGSAYYQKELNRFFQTTGVCWYFPEHHLITEEVTSWILRAFCVKFSVEQHDLGAGLFHSKQSPITSGPCQGACIFDATNGSLRLTKRLAEHFAEVVEIARVLAESEKDETILGCLRSLTVQAGDLKPVTATSLLPIPFVDAAVSDWITVIAPGETAILVTTDGAREVMIKGYHYTPRGLYYDLDPPPSLDSWAAPADTIQPMHGITKMLRANLITGKSEPLG